MPSLIIKTKTFLSREQFLAALIDFGPGRGAIWSNSQSSHFILHNYGASTAEVTEGSKVFGGVWERLHYDWSKPDAIELRTIDSNIWGDKSGWHYLFEEADDGSGTRIIATVTRFPRSKKGYLLLIFLGSIGRPIIKRSFKKTLRAIEKSNPSKLVK